MQKTYWTLYILALSGIIISLFLIILMIMLVLKNILSRKYFFIATTALVFAISLSVYILVPCIKDYSFISNSTFLEEDAIVMEFTYVRDDPDGNGQTQYSKPKFYIESKNEYIVLNVANVELGKKYRIRYLPNTKICQILYCIEE